jgi:hypothetical protein
MFWSAGGWKVAARTASIPRHSLDHIGFDGFFSRTAAVRTTTCFFAAQTAL